MGWANRFFHNEVTTLTTVEPLPWHRGDIIVLYDGNSTTPTSTQGTFRVIVVDTPTYSATVNLELVEFVEGVKKPKYRPPPGVLREVGAPREMKSRHGFQQMARLPCYRGARTR